MGYYRPNLDAFKERSQYNRIRPITTEKKVCANHPISYWGEGFNKCVQGNRRNEECEELTS